MTPEQHDGLQATLRAAARSLKYPATPDVTASVRAAIRTGPAPASGPRLLRLAAVAAIALLAVFVLVPQARALVAGWFRIGIITILPEAANNDEEPMPNLPVTATPITDLAETPGSARVPPALRSLSGLTTLAEAQRAAGFKLLLPTYPDDLGNPDLVFYQWRLQMAILVWLEHDDSENARLTLYEFLSTNTIAKKVEPTVLAETSVNGHPALWLEGPYPLDVRHGDIEWMHIVEGRSLVWERDGITYRLETALSLEEAVRIAESLP